MTPTSFAVPDVVLRRCRAAFRFAVVVLALLAGTGSVRAAEVPRDLDDEDPMVLMRRGVPLERMQDAYLPPPPQTGPARAATSITFGPFTSIQVNVNGIGGDIVGDAANEPSLAVDPNNHNRMVIGYRQFDNVASNFRQAGFAYTSNGGLNWTTGKIEPGVFRSDPVLDIDYYGTFVYNSLKSDFYSWFFRSTTGGATWGTGVFGYGGDKQWNTIDRTVSNVYQAWSTAGNNYLPNQFNKSIDGALTFQYPSEIPGQPVWGTLDVTPDHILYVVGWGQAGICDICLARSVDAVNHTTDPATFTTFPVDLGGMIRTGGPNPTGLLGQLWVATDPSNTIRNGWVYVLASVETPTDPLDVMFVRSTDYGQTWSFPKRINDDPTGTRAFQWFGTLSVSPSGRIDAVWNDTRGSADSTLSALYYSYSVNGGTTWSANQQVSPVWNSTVGWPNQQKIGDYYQTISDDGGVDVAYAATFNGGEDVFYLRIPNTAAPTGVDVPVAAGALRLESFPNPFAGSTSIRFDAPAAGARVRLEVFDLAGHRVATLVDGFRTGPGQLALWDGRTGEGRPAAAGVYLCRLDVGGATRTHKLMRLR